MNPDSGTYFSFREVLCAIKFNTNGIIFEMLRGRPEEFLDTQCLPGSERVKLEQIDEILKNAKERPQQETERPTNPAAPTLSASEQANRASCGRRYCCLRNPCVFYSMEKQ